MMNKNTNDATLKNKSTIYLQPKVVGLTFSGVLTNFKSFIPMTITYNTGLLETMLLRCFSICSSYEKFHEEIVKFKEIFKRNSYSEKFIDRCIKNFLNKLHVPTVVELTAPKKELFLVLPYLGQQSFKIRNRIRCCLRKNAPVFNLKVVFRSRKRLSTQFTFKDKINKMLHSNVIWQNKNYELRVASYELRVEILKAQVKSLKAQVEIQKCEFKSTSYEFKSTRYEFKSKSYEFKSTSYEFKPTSYEFESTSYEFKSMNH